MTSSHSYDTELIHQTVAGIPVPTTRRFTAIVDENGRPLVFSIGNDGVLYLIISDKDGTNELQNFGQRLGFSTHAQAVSASQGPDGDIIVIFAMTCEGNDYGSIHALGPFKSSDLRGTDLRLRSFLLRTFNQPSKAKFEKILIGPIDNSLQPLVIAVFDNEKDTDIARVIIDRENGAFTWKHDLDLPQNANVGSLLDLCPANTVHGQGVFYLYQVGNQQSLVFITTEIDPDYNNYYRLSLGLPNSDENEFSTLLLAGRRNLYGYPPSLQRRDAQPLLLSSDPLYSDIDHLFVAQSDDQITVWFKGRNLLGYQIGNLKYETFFEDEQQPVPFIERDGALEFAAIIDPSSNSQRLLITNDDGKLTTLEQSVTSRLWKVMPFYVPSLEDIIEFESYSLLAHLVDISGVALANTTVRLSSSAWVTATVNGTPLALTSSGISAKTDHKGDLSIVVPVSSLASCTFTISDCEDSLVKHFAEPLMLDPAHKTVSKLANMTAKKLREARTANGEALVDPKVSEEDLENAAQAINKMQKLALEKSNVTSAVSTAESVVTASSEILTQAKHGWLWDAWNWVKRNAKKAWSWIVEKSEKAWHFVVEIAGKAWKFILDTTERILEAIHFVFEKIGAAFKKLIQWIGFIFAWGDILEVSDGISSMVLGLLGYGETMCKKGETCVENFFDSMKDWTKESANVSPALKDKKATNKGVDKGSGDEKVDSTMKSVPFNWSSVRHHVPAEVYPTNSNCVSIKCSMVEFVVDAKDIPIDKASFISGPNDVDFDTFWRDLIQPVWKDLQNMCHSISKKVVEKFRSSNGTTVGEALKEIGIEALCGLIDIVKDLVVGLLRIGGDVIVMLRDFLNKPLRMPVISGLFKLIAKGRPLTLLNAISLLLAVPTTILCKVVTGEKPKRITNFDYEKLVSGKLDKDMLIAYTELAGWVTTTYYMIDGIVEIFKIMTYQVPEVPESPTSPTVISIVLKLVVVAVTFPYDKEAPRWPVRIGLWSAKACQSLIGSILKRKAVSAKAIVAFDLLTGLVSFSLAQVVHDAEFNSKSVDWKDKDDPRTLLITEASVFALIGTIASGYGQLVPEPFQKGAAAVLVGVSAAAQSGIGGVVAARDSGKKHRVMN
ncbi:hypothetical protein BDQ12DRAFT_666536 [Crucibulum laeve]|uniref:Uncharacterized protein n=1 Tax=Crucibulum laeve TaxID=68775 RepID=A0A5C3LXG1_9AGAR|nr:hypothetical protein BDQ12DRAFT_666536 [Crucibulum laeve]